MMTVVVIKVIKISTCQYIALMRNKRCLSPPHRGLMFFWITSSFIYTSSINRIVTLSLSLSLSRFHYISTLSTETTLASTSPSFRYCYFSFNSVIVTNWDWSFTMLVCVLPHNLSDLEIAQLLFIMVLQSCSV